MARLLSPEHWRHKETLKGPTQNESHELKHRCGESGTGGGAASRILANMNTSTEYRSKVLATMLGNAEINRVEPDLIQSSSWKTAVEYGLPIATQCESFRAPSS